MLIRLVYNTVDKDGRATMNLLELARLNDDECRDYLEGLLWPEGPVCPHCQSRDCTKLNGEAHRPGTVQCNDCRGQFTVTVGTVMESSKVLLCKWLMAFHLICSSKKGFAALQLKRELSLGSYKTAWFMMHRVRHALASPAIKQAFSGAVEVDETYVGGKPRPKNNDTQAPAKRGRGTKKTPVVVLVERDGSARSTPVERVDAKTLRSEIRETVERNAVILTDEWSSYEGIGDHFDGGHETVCHSDREYVRFHEESGLPIHVNTAESFFALIKRGHYGVYHQMSKKHLHRYCAEYDFRWNHRKISDSARTEAALQQIGGKRLMYETPV
jgi:transposase-like protein